MPIKLSASAQSLGFQVDVQADMKITKRTESPEKNQYDNTFVITGTLGNKGK